MTTSTSGGLCAAVEGSGIDGSPALDWELIVVAARSYGLRRFRGIARSVGKLRSDDFERRERKYHPRLLQPVLFQEKLSKMPRQNQEVVGLIPQYLAFRNDRDKCARSKATEFIWVH